MTPEITSIRALSDDITKYDIEQHLVRSERFGNDFSFVQIRQELTQLFSAIQKLRQVNLETIPGGLLASLQGSLSQVNQVITRIVQFLPQGPNDGRHTIIAEFQEKNKAFFKALLDALMFAQFFNKPESENSANENSANSSRDFAEYLEKSKNEAQIHFDKIKSESQQQFDSVKESLAILTNKARELGVTKYAEVFKTQSKTYSRNAVFWLICAIIFLGAILGGAAIVLNNPIVKIDSTDNALFVINIIQFALAKLLIASALFYALAVSVKNFRAFRHNAILNKHRQNALETFEAFSNSATDTQTKSAVLVEATHSIFGHQITGFSTSDKDSEVPSKIIEVLKPQISNQ